MIDTKKWRENLRRMIFENEWCFRDTEERMLLDEIDRLTAELDRYRWHPYPREKPEVDGMYQITSKNNVVYSAFYWATDMEANRISWDLHVIAFRPMPEAYKPEVCKTCGGTGAVEIGDNNGGSHLDPCPDCEVSHDHS